MSEEEIRKLLGREVTPLINGLQEEIRALKDRVKALEKGHIK